MSKSNVGSLLLRIGLAFTFIYAGISSLTEPNNWVGYLPAFVPDDQRLNLLKAFSIYEILLAVWLLYGRYVKFAAATAAATLTGITLVNLSIFTVTFRDVGLAFAALALVFVSNRK